MSQHPYSSLYPIFSPRFKAYLILSGCPGQIVRRLRTGCTEASDRLYGGSGQVVQSLRIGCTKALGWL